MQNATGRQCSLPVESLNATGFPPKACGNDRGGRSSPLRIAVAVSGQYSREWRLLPVPVVPAASSGNPASLVARRHRSFPAESLNATGFPPKACGNDRIGKLSLLLMPVAVSGWHSREWRPPPVPVVPAVLSGNPASLVARRHRSLPAEAMNATGFPPKACGNDRGGRLAYLPPAPVVPAASSGNPVSLVARRQCSLLVETSNAARFPPKARGNDRADGPALLRITAPRTPPTCRAAGRAPAVSAAAALRRCADRCRQDAPRARWRSPAAPPPS